MSDDAVARRGRVLMISPHQLVQLLHRLGLFGGMLAGARVRGVQYELSRDQLLLFVETGATGFDRAIGLFGEPPASVLDLNNLTAQPQPLPTPQNNEALRQHLIRLGVIQLEEWEEQENP